MASTRYTSSAQPIRRFWFLPSPCSLPLHSSNSIVAGQPPLRCGAVTLRAISCSRRPNLGATPTRRFLGSRVTETGITQTLYYASLRRPGSREKKRSRKDRTHSYNLLAQMQSRSEKYCSCLLSRRFLLLFYSAACSSLQPTKAMLPSGISMY